MGRSFGTGYSLTFRCAKCKVGRDWKGHSTAGTNLEATGFSKPRPKSDRQLGIRTTDRMIQYHCRDCGHYGYTKHIDAERLLRQRENRL